MNVVSLGRRVLCLAGFALAAPLAAQTGTVTGRVTDSVTKVGLANVEVVAVNATGGIGGNARSAPDGAFRILNLANGAYSLEVRGIGFLPKRVTGVNVNGTTTVDIDLARTTMLSEVVVTTTRGATAEKVQDAPAAVYVVSEEAIATRPSLTVADHMKSTPGVDISTGGIVQSNVVARGFNNIFSGALLMLQDFRFAGVPSLRVNVPFLFTGTNEDIERVEVVLGPASALYGPNSANGVLHVITKSPFNSLGTNLTVDVGDRSIFRTSARHAMALGERFALKLSGEYMTGKDFAYTDPGEPNTFPSSAPPGRAGEANTRDFGVERYAGEARLDYRGANGLDAVTTVGLSNVLSGIELTGANGAAFVKDWSYMNVQQRLRKGRLFLQGFANFSNAGNENSSSLEGTYLLRSGQPIVDQSRVFAFQAQHGFDVGRSAFTYGADYIFTNPRTGNTINGRNEDIDNVTEYGGYIQGTVPLTQKVDFVSALRLDTHSEIEGAQFSPRASLVFRPSDAHQFRATFNRAFQTPANFSYFLDLIQRANVDGAGLNIRAVGNHGGRQFDRGCAGSAFDDFCMRSQYNNAAREGASAAAAFSPLIDARAAAFTGLITQQLIASGNFTAPQAAGIAAVIMGGLQGAAPTNADLTTRVAYLLNPLVNITPTQLTNIKELKASFNNTLELGYKGLLGERGRLSVDAWWQRRGDVNPPAGVATPTVFFDGANVGAYVGTNVVQTLVPFFMSAQGGSMSQPQAQATATAIANQLAPQAATILASAPLGTVTFDDETRSDVLFTYFTVDRKIEVYGVDLGYDWLLTNRLTLSGTYSWQSENVFDNVVFDETTGANGLPFMSNSPKNKMSLTMRYDDARKYAVEVRGRYADAFPVNSGVYYSGKDIDDPNSAVPTDVYQYPSVPVFMTLDAGVTWRQPFGYRNLTWSLNGTNILNNERPTFAGTPLIGSMVMTRLSYTF
ncbi:MAG TPA: TonB-dependent receptor [Gemmatimonadaceae bacterium]|nr:TonB-dependent receptor [Gemmatimonadaceae bacterium]